MALGRYMRELADHRLGLAVIIVAAVLAATCVLYKVGIAPPGLERRSLSLASGSTQVIVDTPHSAITDLRQNTYSLTALTNRALLLGDVMASYPVRGYIAARAGIAPGEIAVTGPTTPEEPRVIADSGHQPKTTDILKSPEEYRISIQANPTVPVLDISTEAPDGDSAVRLADAAAAGLRDYVESISEGGDTPSGSEVTIRQLGHAVGGRINQGAGAEFALLAFLAVLLGGSGAILLAARVGRGWRQPRRPARRDPRVGSEWAR